MSDLYGAPSGIIAEQEQYNKNLGTAFAAQKTLGEIGMQPLDAEIKRQHARLYGAEADKLGMEAADAEQLRRLGADLANLRNSGVEPTVADLATAGRPKPTTGDYFSQAIDLAIRRGVSPKVVSTLAKDAATVTSREAATVSHQMTALNQQMQAQRRQAENLGAEAAFALQGPQQYQQWLLQLAGQGQDVSMMPDFAAARPMLQGLVDQAMTVKQKIDADLKKRNTAATELRSQASAANNYARVALSKERLGRAKEDRARANKYDGEKSQAALEARKAEAGSRRAYADDRDKKNFPPAPLDPAARTVGNTYTGSDGQRYVWAQDSAGNKGWLPYRGSTMRGRPTSQVEADDETDDDEDD